jgi:hypothetical protein
VSEVATEGAVRLSHHETEEQFDMPVHNPNRHRTRAPRVIGLMAGVLAAAAVAAPAQANLALTGPMNPLTNFPAWYEDANGTRLELCIADPGCPVSPPVLEPVAPNDEAFYSLVSGTATGPAGQEATMDFAVEAAFLDTPVTFGRVQVTLKGMQPDSAYTITYPYGTAVWTTGATGTLVGGARAAQRHEAGCFLGFDPPCDITLRTEISPFLTWDPAESAPPAGYIGDGATLHTITGTVNNFFRVEGPGLPAGGIGTNRFTVQGKLASPATPIFFAAPGSGDFGTQRVNTPVTRTVTVKNNGLAPTQPITATAISGPDAASFAPAAETCSGAAVASGATCTIDVTFTPAHAGALSASLDLTDAGGTHSVPLSGTAGDSAVNATPAVVNFLNQNVSTTSPQNVVTIDNTGPVSLNISGASISGANAGEFAIAGNDCTRPVAPGASCTIGLKFLPAASGTRNAQLDLTSDAAGSPQAIPLTGNGTILPGDARTAPAKPAPRLALTSLTARHRLSRRDARRSGLHVSMGVPKGTSTVTLRVFRVAGTKRQRIATAARVVQHPGLNRLKLSSAALRRRLVPGRYVLEVTPSAGAEQPGSTSTLAFRVTR